MNAGNRTLDNVLEESARVALLLFRGNVVATVLSALCGILIARLLGPELYGAYSLIYTVVSFLVMFTGLGINATLTRFISCYWSDYPGRC